MELIEKIKDRQMKKLSWNEICNYSGKELKAHYKLNDRQVEQKMRHHLDGASHSERREVYQQLWKDKR
jgi:hypothetical protein